jgi:cold shock CspA family protein
MQIPLDITFRGVKKTKKLEDLIREKTAKLETICNYISGCRVAVEKTQKHQRSGNPYRVRIDLTVPPGHEIVVSREPGRGDIHLETTTEIRDAFEAALKQLKELVDRQRGEMKTHPKQEVHAVVSKLFKTEGYGFIKTLDGREIYFHRNSVLNDDFDNLTIGTGINFTEKMSEKGPHASTVRIVGRPGHKIPESDHSEP